MPKKSFREFGFKFEVLERCMMIIFACPGQCKAILNGDPVSGISAVHLVSNM